MRYLFLLLILMSNFVHGQSKTMRFHPELSFYVSGGLPLGGFAEGLKNVRGDTLAGRFNGAGSFGLGAGVMLETRLYRRPNWSFSLAINYQSYFTDAEKLKVPGDVWAKASNWGAFTVMPGAHWESQGRFKFGLGISGGLLFASGFDPQRRHVLNSAAYVTDIQNYKSGVGFVASPSMKLVYSLNKKTSIFAGVNYQIGMISGRATVQKGFSYIQTPDNYYLLNDLPGHIIYDHQFMSVGVFAGVRVSFHKW